MKRVPTRIFWELIGDFFTCTILDDRRRSVEGFWQGMADQAADALAYTTYYQDAKSIFRVEPFAPYGSFPADVRLVDVESATEGLLIGAKNGRYSIYSEDQLASEKGSFRIGTVNYAYKAGTSTPLLSGGYILSLSTGASLQPAFNPSSFFNRFIYSGSRNSFDLDWVNASVLQDSLYMDGSQDWRQVYRLNIDNWDNTDRLRLLSFNSFGDTGPSYEARLYDDGSSIKVAFGQFAVTKNSDLDFSGSTITRYNGTWGGDGFEVGQTITISGTTNNNGDFDITSVTPTTLGVSQSFVSEFSTDAIVVNNLAIGIGDSSSWRASFTGAVEFEISYNATNATMTGAVYYGGEKVSQSAPYSVNAGRRINSISLWNQQNNVKVTPLLMVSTGAIWGETALDYTTDIGTEFSYIYEIEEPLISADTVRTEPWPLSQKLEVLYQSQQLIQVEIDEEFAGYIPEFARLKNENGTFSTAQWNGMGYVPISYINLDDEVTVEPWYDSEVIFEKKGRFRLRQEIPQERMWFINAKAVELDMYSRYGRELKMPKREDSQTYLNALRGMQYGLLSPATYKHFERAIGVISGLPYSTEEGVISSIDLVTNILGEPTHYDVNINGITIKVDPFWGGYLKPVGSSIDFLGLLVEGVNIYDWKNNAELTRERFGDWAQWGGFVVQIPAFVGINETIAGDIFRLLDRSKSIHSNFKVEYKADLEEDLPYELDRARSYQRTEVIAETIAKITENLSFEPTESLVQNLDEGRLLDTNHVLDGTTIKASGRTSSLLFVDRPTDTNRPWINSLVNSGMRNANVQDSRNMWVVGDADQIFYSKNLGKTWIAETVLGGTGGSFKYVSRGVACQASNFIWVRNDDGVWSKLAAPFQVDFVVGDLPYIMAINTSSNTYVRSEDFGLTWGAPVALPGVGVRDVISYGINNIGYMGDSRIWRSLDGGITWTGLTLGSHPPTFIHLAYDIAGNQRGFGSIPVAAYNVRGWVMVTASALVRADYIAASGTFEFTFPDTVRRIATGNRAVIVITTAGVWTR